MKRVVAGFLVLSAVCAASVEAHHSYAGYDPDERFILAGTLTDVQWGNPHILLFVDDGTRTVRVEWITLTGAELTGADREQFTPGEAITVIGSRNANRSIPVMTIIKQIDLPDDGWHWERPTSRRSLP